jgi:hypothetical protein
MLFMLAITMTTPPEDVLQHKKSESSNTPKPQAEHLSPAKFYVLGNDSASTGKLASNSSPQVVALETPLNEPTNDHGPFQISVFDKIPNDSFDKLDPIQQSAFVNAEERFNAFFREWTAAGKTNSEEWNARVKEFHQEMLLNFGPDEMDRLLQSSSLERAH